MTRLRATSQVISTKTISSGPHSAGRATASPCRCEPGGRNGHPLRVMLPTQDAFYRSLGEGTAPDATLEHRPDPDRLPISPATLPAARAPSAAAPGGSERQRALLRAEHRGPGDPARGRHGCRHVDRTCHRPSGGSFGHGPQRALRCPAGGTDRLHGTGSRVRAEPGPRPVRVPAGRHPRRGERHRHGVPARADAGRAGAYREARCPERRAGGRAGADGCPADLAAAPTETQTALPEAPRGNPAERGALPHGAETQPGLGASAEPPLNQARAPSAPRLYVESLNE